MAGEGGSGACSISMTRDRFNDSCELFQVQAMDAEREACVVISWACES